ncbi:MAG: hypothetical protein LBH43_17335, partial [Treponema sp.]|nr:hypothetical protein [Treponema sp.]
MNKRFMTMLLVACILGIPGCENTPSPDNPEDEIKQEPFEYPTDFYQSFTRANIYSNGIPEQYRWTDYKALAEKFHNLAFDTSAAGNWLPLSRMNGGRIEMQTYVSNVFGNEGITLIPAMVSASLNGFDLTGKLQTADSFFNTTEGVITNNAGSSSAGMSMWYMLFPALHYTWLSLLNPNEAAMRQNCLATIGRWYDAYQLMKDSHFISIYLSNFTARNFNFAVNNVVNKPSGGNWAEPDCAAGMAVLFYNGYKLSGDQKY